MSYTIQRVFGRTQRGALWIGVLLLMLTLSLGCKKQTRRTTTLANTPAVKADSAEAQRSFDEALTALEEGRYSESQEAFKAVQANHEGDAIAELYTIRAEMGQILLEKGGTGAPSLSSMGRGGMDALVARLRALSSALVDSRSSTGSWRRAISEISDSWWSISAGLPSTSTISRASTSG